MAFGALVSRPYRVITHRRPHLRKRYDVDEIKRLARIIDVIARKCWRGLPALMGDVPKPTRQQLKDALFYRPSPEVDLGTKVQSSGSGEGREILQEDTMIDEVDSVLDLLPWEELVSCVRRYAKEYPTEWAMYKKLLIAQEQKIIGWGDIGALSRTAEAFDVSDYVLRMRARQVPFAIARSVSMGYGRDDVLRGGE